MRGADRGEGIRSRLRAPERLEDGAGRGACRSGCDGRPTAMAAVDASIGARGLRPGHNATRRQPAPRQGASIGVLVQGLTVVRPTLSQSCIPPRYHLSLWTG
jgi:hypothetical protein